MADPNRLLLYR